jgi:hypothetical protein
MLRKTKRRFGTMCLDCGYIGTQEHFRCDHCRGANVVEDEYIICPTELKGCKEKVLITGLPEHLALVHPHEMAWFYCEKVLRIYQEEGTGFSKGKFSKRIIWSRYNDKALIGTHKGGVTTRKYEKKK